MRCAGKKEVSGSPITKSRLALLQIHGRQPVPVPVQGPADSHRSDTVDRDCDVCKVEWLCNTECYIINEIVMSKVGTHDFEKLVSSKRDVLRMEMCL